MRVNTIICIIQKLIIDYSDDEDDKVTIVCKAVLQWLEAPLPHLGRGFSNPIFLFSLTTQHHSVTTLLQIITTCSMKRKKQINTIYNDFCLSHIGTCEVFGSTSSLVQVTRKKIGHKIMDFELKRNMWWFTVVMWQYDFGVNYLALWLLLSLITIVINFDLIS